MATRTIGTEIVLSGEKQFNDAMKGVNNNLKNLKTEMAVVAAEFDDNADSMEALTRKETILKESVDQHRAKVAALNEMYEQQKTKHGENSAQADKYRQQLNAATVAMLKEEKALSSAQSALAEKRAALEKLADSENDAADATQDNAKAEEKAGDAAGKAEKKQTAYAKSLDLVKAGAKGVGAATALAAKGLATVTAAAAAGSVAVLTQMVSMAKDAAEAAKAAQEAGETLTESQQQWLDYSNQLDALDTSVSSAKSALATVLLPVLSDLSTDGAAFLNDFTRDMNAAAGDTGAQTQVLTDYIVKGASLIKEKLPEYMEMGKELFSSLGAGLSEVGPDILEMGGDLVMDLLEGILDEAPQLAQAGMSLIKDQLLPGLISRGPDAVSSGADMVSQIISGLAKAAPQLIPMATNLVVQLGSALLQSAPQLLTSGVELVLGIIAGIMMSLGELTIAAYELVLKIQEGFEEKVDAFHDMGGNIIEFIKKGITDAWEGLVRWFNNLWDDFFKDRDVDVNVNTTGSSIPGHATGLDYVPYDNYLARLHQGEMVLTRAEAAQYRRGQGQGSRIVNLTINAKTITEADINMVVDIVNRKLGEDL